MYTAMRNNLLHSILLLLRGMLLVIVALLLINGCASRRTEPPGVPGGPEELSTIQPQTKGPAHDLYTQARDYLAQGNNKRAEIAMERALRIEPGNAFYWYTMGRIKYRQGQNSRAIQFCLKSKSLAGGNHRLISMNDALIDNARQQ